MNSIRRRLLGWLICGFAAASVVAGIGIFHTAREEAGELFDYELHAVALSMPANVATAREVEQSGPGFDEIADDRILIAIWDRDGKLIYHSQETPTLPRQATGFRTIEHDEVHWRVFGLAQPERFVQVAQPISVRDTLALHLALHTLWPLALLVPVAIVLVLFVVTRGLAPVRGLSTLLAARSVHALEPLRLDGSVPVELRPLVEALNDLLDRLNAASQAQRTFIADAAHELRSPLAALKLQWQAALHDGTLSGEPRTLERMQTRLNRTIRLVQQLLTLAREDAQASAPSAIVSLRRLGEQAIGDFSLLAEEKGIDLGLESRPPVTPEDICNVSADPHGLNTLLNNLLDNAIRHTPSGGKIDLVLTRAQDTFGFEVVDNGPGIPEADLERVLDRFFRGDHAQGTGSGLGLSIVARIAQRQGLTFKLRNNPGGRGLTAAVSGLQRRTGEGGNAEITPAAKRNTRATSDSA
ncbi:ATP-binding protein [Paraburkholderia unamae]|uniref:histidine kinase n=1 Tax=Paraburkholderia unamae TaxID=219649 RepID=A0ABX5KTW4_9BURK|nr:ATP-binding protein [Paraburkholderia unamae]PVX86280.1 two-component system OmpR family sensor kinase [Paraburkholderia unamae]RAR68174.1 two-component system OmpR family sensor kinase [Paraburkholderia unamae]CAG9264146.1 Sensory histidine kinase QseC [Paraburkholderia unamae]